MVGNWTSQISWLRRPRSEGPIQAGMECAGEQTPADPDKKRALCSTLAFRLWMLPGIHSVMNFSLAEYCSSRG